MRPPETVYRGERLIGPGNRHLGVVVTVDGRVLDPRPSWKLRNHSPTGFEWGYMGSGPAQLALALVYDATGDGELSLRCYQDYKMAAVNGWVDHTWSVTAGAIREWVARWEESKERRPCDVHRTVVIPAGEGGAA